MPKALIFTIVLLVSSVAHAQLKRWPVSVPAQPRQKKNLSRIESDTLQLPFFDDFSTSMTTPDPTKWRDSENVFVSTGIAIDPPSIGVASLDGVKTSGTGYIENALTSKVDALTSCFIDISSLDVNDDVYISFFYQAGGNGDMPDEQDSLRLEVLDSNGEWQSIWPKSADLNLSGTFEQVLVKLDDPAYFHEGFSFKFQSFGAIQGFFDVWNIDYVYVNKNRNDNDRFYPDRATASTLGPLFDNRYYAIPIEYFDQDLITPPSYDVYALHSADMGEGPSRPIFDNLSVRATSFSNGAATNNTFQYRSPNGGLIFNQERITYTLSNIDSLQLIGENVDSAYLEVNVSIDGNDDGDFEPRFAPIDFKVNNSFSTTYAVTDYFAYDDGTAEGLVGFDQSGNRVAVRYDLPTGVTDSISAIDLHVGLLESNPEGLPLELFIWGAVENEDGILIPGSIISNIPINISLDSVPSSLTRYTFYSYKLVTGTFFIGYRQTSATPVGIGFDLSNDTSDKVFSNTGAQWVSDNSSALDGSIMIRPVFGELDEVTSIDDPLNSARIYPNPTNDKFSISGLFDHVAVYDFSGKEIFVSKVSENEFDLSLRPSGLYFVKIFDKQQSRTFKLIKK